MKYWAYLNDEVSQTSYTEAELQKLSGFGPDLLICSESSAISQDPDWRPVKELLPHLIRPKAPNFSKFRPKPPVVNAQNNSSNSASNGSSASMKEDLLAQIKSLTEKVASLEGKSLAGNNNNNLPDYSSLEDVDGEETFVSEPQNEGEDDVLEVPFDNDFEVPFDVNKSSEEIASEAEALLDRPTAEIEEFNTDDQHTELLNYSSDMQKILEDTIRKTNVFARTDADSKSDTAEDSKSDKRVFIAEDLISKTTLSFTDDNKEGNADKQESEEKDTPQNVSLEDNEKKEKEDETPSSDTERLAEEIFGEKDTVEEKPIQEEVAEGENKESSLEKEESEHPENSVPAVNIEESTEKAEPEQEKPQTDLIPENKTEELKEDIQGQEKPQADVVPENKTEELKEDIQEQEKPQADVVPENKTEELKEDVEEQEKPQLVSLDSVPDAHQVNTSVQEEPEEEPQLVSLDSVPEDLKLQVPIQEETEQEEEPQLASLKAVPEDLTLRTPVKSEPEQNKPQLVSLDSDISKENEQSQKDSDLNLDAMGDINVPSVVQIQDDANEDKVDNLDIMNSDAKEVSFEDEAKGNPADQAANLTLTKGVTISRDETTAAVLEEIAREKEQSSKSSESTVNKLFEELENTYKEDKDNSLEVSSLNDQSSEDNGSQLEADLGDESANEDEFLKTFTTSVEEVFLDQPTAIISDYVPPTEDTSEHSRPTLADSKIKREKPSDIKTVPLVPEALGQEIWSSPYVDSATTKLGKGSVVTNLLKWIVLIAAFSGLGILLLSGLAVMGIISERFSPIHTVIYSLQKSPQEKANGENADLSPEIVEDYTEEEEAEDVNPNASVDVMSNVKNYTFKDGTTLESRIKSAHQNLNGEIEWSLFPTEEQDIYSVAVKIPATTEGQSFSYRFNYNLAGNELTPTTSLAKNIMEN